MATYVFSIDSVEVHNQKAASDHSDSDWLTFTATVGNINTKQVRTAPAGTFHIGNIIHTGDTLTGPFRSDPITVADDETFAITYLITNLGSSDTEDEFAQAVKVGAKVVETIATGVETIFSTITTGDPTVGIAIGAKITAAVDAVINTLSDLFDFLGIHFSAANCNGEVLHDTLPFQPTELAKAVNQSASREYEGPQPNKRCGLAPHSKVTFSIHVLPVANFSAQKHSGNPVLIQGRFGRQGNFELLVPLATGGLAAYFRINDGLGFPWGGPAIVGSELGRVDAVTMIQSNFESPGNLEVIARVGDRLKLFFRTSDLKWKGPFPLIADGVEVSAVSGNPVLLQSRFGKKGNFELLAPLAKGGLAFFFRDNDDPSLPWHGPVIFGSSQYAAVTMIQSNFTDPGNLEVIASIGTTLHLFFRDSEWKGPVPVILAERGEPFVVSNPVLIQSRFGKKGNFEVIAPEASFSAGEGIVHFFRDNDDPALPWHQSTVFGRGSSQTDRIGALTMIQSNFGDRGSLEVIARIGERLAFFFRDSGTGIWNGPFFM